MHSRPFNILLGLLLGLLTLQAAAKRDGPDITSTPFEGIPVDIFYFEDSDTVLVTNEVTQTVYRSTDGGSKWKPLEGVDPGVVIEVLQHPFDKKVAVILGYKKRHWITRDRGETWDAFETEYDPSRNQPGISFHADDSNRMLYLAEDCGHLFCTNAVYYTTDGFKSSPKLLREDLSTCLWAKSTDVFTTGNKDRDQNTILCIAQERSSALGALTSKVLVTTDYFKTAGVEPVMSDDKPVHGVTNLAAVKRYIVFAAKSEHTIELSMQVTTDAETWHRAELGEHRLEENAYTLLQSTNYSMQVDVVNGSSPMGILLTSESNGTFFSKSIEHTNRNALGLVDFEKVSNIQGIVMINVVDNWEDLGRHGSASKKLKSKISFDDGRTWSPLRAGEDDLHLHSVTEQKNIGRIFSSPAPGIVMGIGNTGKYLSEYADGDLYVSHDAGLSWTLARENPHLYEFGASGSVLVAVEHDETNVIQWSLDYGKSWQTTELEAPVKPALLTTTPDSTSLKFLMIASTGRGQKRSFSLIALDFADLHERECKSSDFEKWPARVYDDGKAQCIMGHKQYFRRRKLDADCLVVVKDFEDPEMTSEDCECEKEDFECDYGFVREDGEASECVPIGSLDIPKGACKEDTDKFKGRSGYRLIPGNTCKRKGGVQLDEEKEWSCDGSSKPKAGDGKITPTKFSFNRAEGFVEDYYLERGESSSGHDETIIMRTDRGEVWLTEDHGKKWKQLLKGGEYEDEKVVAIYPHQYVNEYFYLITDSQRVIYSQNRGGTLHDFKAPEPPNFDRLPLLQFHPKQKDWLIWTGRTDCHSGDQCRNVAHVSRKGGENWELLTKGVRKCLFVYRPDRKDSEDLVYCEEYESDDPDSPISLVSSTDWFDHKDILKRDVVNYAAVAEYIVVAVRDEDKKSLKVDASIDGVTFADAQFPQNFPVDHQRAYTVLDSRTHAVFLHVTVNGDEDREFGSILKSNSNGTSYALSVSEVNRNRGGYVDFEKMQGLEGVSIVNRVSNPGEGGAKKLKTYMTHNDGAGWDLLSRPEDPPKDVGDSYDCSGSKEKCSLHLHGYTERSDPSVGYSSPNAVGIMIANGNVGEYLGPRREANTFITTDAGISWKFVRKGNWMWAFGDQGSVIVIVKADEATNSVLYTLDEGSKWIEFKFDDERMEVEKLSTVPSDTSLNFLLWGKIKGELVTVNLDFSGLSERSEQCKLDEQNPTSDESDYKLWAPKHPLLDDDCLFGHVAQYHRKKPERNCFNGREIPHLHSVERNCTCAREDFECDYNFEPGPNGLCQLVPGAQSPDPAEACAKDPSLDEYNGITGYRRIPLDTCSGGRDLEFTSKKYPCPHHEEEYRKKHGISGAGLFFAITLPIAAAAAFGYWAYRSWDGKFGRIQLGDANSPSGASLVFFDRDAPWIRYPVLALSGVVAVLAALPMVVGSLWRAVSTRLGRRGGGSGGGGLGGGYARPFTSRSSFARGRGNYSVIDPDDAELLGDESDEEV